MSMKSRTPNEIKERLANDEQVTAIFRLEGMEPPPGADELFRMRAKGEITGDQIREIAKKIVMDEITDEESVALARKMAVTENV
jgi:hypothetical protein